ncbi:MAG TPA: hypothetical protein VNI52_10935 [Sphingobacteriaceae bacterium]|nr:hypothetical protein [Sphingobacteriaceae bacterium]
MNKKAIMLSLFVTLGAATIDNASAQQVNLPEILRGNRVDESKVYQDDRGTYHYETRERRVWVPEQRTRGVFGTRTEPGHYETIREQVKIYHNRNNDRNDRNNRDNDYGDSEGYKNKKGKKGHPHGMPPGQRKKQGDRDRDDDDDRYEDRRNDRRAGDRDDD